MTTDELFAKIQELAAQRDKQQAQRCPDCGRCPTCGHTPPKQTAQNPWARMQGSWTFPATSGHLSLVPNDSPKKGA